MKPDCGEAVARGMVDGLLGLLTQPLVIITLVVVIGVSIVARQQKRRRSGRR
jgi:hypothetical protein